MISVFRNTSSSGNLSFASMITFQTSHFPTSIAITDVDGDGKNDITVTNTGAASVSIFRNTSVVDTISLASKIDIATGTQPYGAAFGDLNGDGKIDMAVSIGTSTSLDVFINTSSSGNISFAPKINPGNYYSANCVEIVDVNSDTKPDLVYITTATAKISVICNNPIYSTNANLSSIAISSGVLSPTFSPNTISYFDTVGNSISSITLNTITSDTTANVKIRINNGAYTNISNGTASLALPLNVGNNSIEIKVVAQDGVTIKTYTISVRRLSLQLNLKVYLQGLYLGNGKMIASLYKAYNTFPANIADTITLELHSDTGTFDSVYSMKGILDTIGNALFSIPSTHNNKNYYLVVRHRNSIATWSSIPITFNNNSSFEFTTSSKAFGNNMLNDGNGKYLIYSGDINQDGSIDFNDYQFLDIDASNGALGYFVTDLNSDASVDFNDYPFLDVNSSNGIISIRP